MIATHMTKTGALLQHINKDKYELLDGNGEPTGTTVESPLIAIKKGESYQMELRRTFYYPYLKRFNGAEIEMNLLTFRGEDGLPYVFNGSLRLEDLTHAVVGFKVTGFSVYAGKPQVKIGWLRILKRL